MSDNTIGRRLLPVIIDQRARDEPDRPWCSLPRDDYDLEKGFEDISYGTFANAINQLAWFIESAIGKSTSFETITYLGISDIRYHMIQMAVCKTGHKVLFSAHTNSTEVHVCLMEQTDSNVLVSALGVHVDDILSSRPVKHLVIPELDNLLEAEKVPVYPYEKTFEEAAKDPYIVFHTSGTTGMPKMVEWNHDFIAVQDRRQIMPDIPGGKRHMMNCTHPGEGVRCLLTTPPYHAGGSGFAMCTSVFGGSVIIIGYRHRGLKPEEVTHFLACANVSKAVLMTWMMESIARHPNAEQFIKPLTAVCYGGAVLSSFAAKTFAKYTFIQNVWGSTEALTVPQIEGENEDYEYIHFDTLSTDGLKFLPVENTGYVSETGVALELYEFVHRLTPTSAPFLGWHVRQNLKLSSNESENPEWHTGDLWTPHPDPEKAAYAWKFVCRKDDLICFATGMNGHPAPIERVIIENPKVNAMVLVGEQHQQTLALIELAAGYEVTRELACEIWDETITQANEKAQVHMRVAKTHVLLVPFGSFETTPKGSVVRKGTVSKYRDVIEETYANFGDKWQDGKDRYGSISQTTSITVEIEMEGEEREEDEGEDKSTPTA